VSLERRCFDDREEQAGALAKAVAADLAAAIDARGKASLAVPGGTTPAAFLTALGGAELAWDKIAVTLTDERWVPPDAPRSNQRLLRETLLAGGAAARVLPLYRADLEPTGDLGALAAQLEAILPLDICVLGMGEDRHTASLFPGADRLDEALSDEAPPVLALSAPGAPEPRVTLTAPVLRGAGKTYLLISGSSKLAALEEALLPGPAEEAPVRAVLHGPRPVTLFYAP